MNALKEAMLLLIANNGLSHLYELKLVDFVFLGKNRRTKYVHPTSMAEIYFSALGKCLSKAAKSTDYD